MEKQGGDLRPQKKPSAYNSASSPIWICASSNAYVALCSHGSNSTTDPPCFGARSSPKSTWGTKKTPRRMPLELAMPENCLHAGRVRYARGGKSGSPPLILKPQSGFLIGHPRTRPYVPTSWEWTHHHRKEDSARSGLTIFCQGLALLALIWAGDYHFWTPKATY
ncbi:hypothetical protein F5B20DRAFT_183671 [Whalleya microplaca]|nr:hypothetical protein F5B20DRAFT_183671 [Whalleya microplaca]